MFVGLGFKVAAAPFHIWTPDVYEELGPVVGFMSTAPGRGVRVLLRIMFEAHAPGRLWLIWVTAALSMTIGTWRPWCRPTSSACWLIRPSRTPAICWSPLRRCGKRHSRRHVLHRVLCCDDVGAFAVVSHFAGAGERYVNLEDYAGLGGGRRSWPRLSQYSFCR